MHPMRQNFISKHATAKYNKHMAIGSLNSLRTNIEWIRCDVKHIIINAMGGTFFKFQINI